MLQEQSIVAVFQCLYKTLRTTVTCTIKNTFVSLLPECSECMNIVNGNREALNKDPRCCLMGLVINSRNKVGTYLFMGNYDTKSPMKPSNILNILSYYQMYELWNNSFQVLTNKCMMYVFLISIEYFKYKMKRSWVSIKQCP